MEILFKREDLIAVTHHEDLKRMTLYYGDGKTVIVHDISRYDYLNIDLEYIFGKINRQNKRYMPFVGFKFYNKKLHDCFEIIGDEIISCKWCGNEKNLTIQSLTTNKIYTMYESGFHINVLDGNIIRNTSYIPEDYRCHYYINKKTGQQYDCGGWNYKKIYLGKNESTLQIVVELDNLLNDYWIIDKEV